jgi:hypothetical protein
MSLAYLSQEEAIRDLLAEQAGPSDLREAVCDWVRSEVHARGHAPRAATISRIVRLFGAVPGVDGPRVEEACDALEREGDIVLNPGGVLYATPTRLVALGRNARVFSSLPTRVLAQALDCPVASSCASRTVCVTEGLERAVDRLGGVWVSPEAWAGLDRAPVADEAFLARIDERLQWQAVGPGLLDKEGALEWRAWRQTSDGPGWRQSTEGRLWMARTRYGGRQGAWTAGGPPSTCPSVLLSPDETDRARFALTRSMGSPLLMQVERGPQFVALSIPGWIPRPEYRWLSLQAHRTEADGGPQWQIPVELAQRALTLLGERLGFVAADAHGDPEPEEPTEHSGTSHDFIESEATPPTDEWSPLDDDVPVPKALGPLLRTLGVQTYRDLLTIDASKLPDRPGVGRTKAKVVGELIVEARNRAVAAGILQPSQEVTEATATEGPAPSKAYDDWSPYEALGALTRRAVNILVDCGIETVGQLRSWYRGAKLSRIRNYGRGTHAHLGELLRRLDEEGHEAIVFNGTTPQTVQELGERFLGSLEGEEREVVKLRLVDGLTLEAVGAMFQVTRERIRQMQEVVFSRHRPSWSTRVRQLLEPAMAALAEGGGVILTNRLIALLGSPRVWTVQLALEIAELEVNIDVIPGITSSLPRPEFDRLRRELRERLADGIEPLNAHRVHGTFGQLGFSFPAEDLGPMSDAMAGVIIDGEAAFPSRRSIQYLYLKAAMEARGPVSAEEIARRVNELDPSIAATKRSVVAQFRRAGQVLSHSHNRWIHRDNLAVPREVTDALAQTMLSEIKAEGGRSVSVRRLLDRWGKDRTIHPDLTPNVMRDVLIATGEVRGWRAGADVAWLGGEISKITIAKWLDDVAFELEQPFEASELIDEVSERSGYLRDSVLTQVYSGKNDIIPVAHGQFVSVRRVWPSDSAFEAVRKRAEKFALAQPLRSVEAPDTRVPGLEAEIERFGTGVVWGLATKATKAVSTRELGWFMWPTAMGSTLFSVIASVFLSGGGLFRASHLNEWLFSLGSRSRHVAHNLLKEGTSEGTLVRVGLGWYIDSRLPLARQVELLEGARELRRLALGSQDFVRESPLRLALNEVRARHGMFRVPGA